MAIKARIVILVLSFLGGAVGTAWSIYSSFKAVDVAENAGIGAVGDQIQNALLWSVGGLVGMIIGAALIVLGRPKRSPDPAERN